MKTGNETNAKAGNTNGTNAQTGNTEDGTDKDEQATPLTSRSSSSQALTTTVSQLALATSSEEQAVGLLSVNSSLTKKELGELKEILEDSNKVCRENTLKWVKKWGECLKHFDNMLLCCKRHNNSGKLGNDDIENLVKAFNFIIENNTISPSEKDVLISADVGLFKNCEAAVKDELAIPYNLLRNICLTARTRKKFGIIRSEITNNNEFKANVYDVFQKNKGSIDDVNSILPLVTVLSVKVAERIRSFGEYGGASFNQAATSIAKLSDPLVNSLLSKMQLLGRSLFVDFYRVGNRLVYDASQTIADTFVDVTRDIRRDFANGGADDIIEPIANKMEGALKNAATTSLDYAKITALQTGAGLAGVFVAAKLACNLISKIGSDSNNRNKQKQAVAENCEQPHKVENQ